MIEPTSGELRALTTFFKCAAPKNLGLYDRKAKGLRENAEENPLFKKNLELLRELTRRGVDLKRIEQYCRFCMKEKRQVQWINEAVPTNVIDSDSLERNLINDDIPVCHRLLRKVSMPVTTLEFGASSSTGDGDVYITRVESFTMGNLLDYFCTSFGLRRTQEIDRSHVGAFNYLLASYSLDSILYAIDYALANSSARITSPLQLQNDFLVDAEDEIRGRKARV